MISLNIENHVANILIDDGRANVISKHVADDFIEALDEAEQSAKATIVTGGGDKFCAGFDLQTVKSAGKVQVEMVTSGFTLLYRLYSHSLPLIAACNGHAIGMGAFILLCSDTKIGAKHEYKIGLPETAGGMPFTPLLVSILQRELHRPSYNSTALQSQMCSPENAVKANFLDLLVDAEELAATAQMAAQQLMQLPLEQYGENKLMLRHATLTKIKAELQELGVSL